MSLPPYRAFEQLTMRMAEEFPGFRLKDKSGWFWRLLVTMLPAFNGMWVTIGRTVYVPDLDTVRKFPTREDYATLWHERQHVADLARLQKAVGGPLGAFLWAVGYASPQILALGVLGAFWTPYAWLCLLALGPWPAPFRVWVEKRGYLASLEAWMGYNRWVPPDDNHVHRMVRRYFTGWSYYLMYWGSPRVLADWFHNACTKMSDDAHREQHTYLLPHEVRPRHRVR